MTAPDRPARDLLGALQTSLEAARHPRVEATVPDRPTPSDDGTFGLRTALGEDGTAELLRRQRRTALAYGEHAAAERATAWLAANGYEEASDG